jgi:hypothetical protein
MSLFDRGLSSWECISNVWLIMLIIDRPMAYTNSRFGSIAGIIITELGLRVCRPIGLLIESGTIRLGTWVIFARSGIIIELMGIAILHAKHLDIIFLNASNKIIKYAIYYNLNFIQSH